MTFMHWAKHSGVERIVWRAVVCRAIRSLRRRRIHATQRSVGAALGLSPGTAWDMFLELRDAGLLTWPAHETDRTAKVGVLLTGAGEGLAEQAGELCKNTRAQPPAALATELGDFWPMGPCR